MSTHWSPNRLLLVLLVFLFSLILVLDPIAQNLPKFSLFLHGGSLIIEATLFAAILVNLVRRLSTESRPALFASAVGVGALLGAAIGPLWATNMCNAGALEHILQHKPLSDVASYFLGWVIAAVSLVPGAIAAGMGVGLITGVFLLVSNMSKKCQR